MCLTTGKCPFFAAACNDTSDQSSCLSDNVQENVEVEAEVEQQKDVDEIKTDEGNLTEPYICLQPTKETCV